MAEAHVNIGSNIGDRRALIERAVAAISLLTGEEAGLRCSSIFESEAWGFESENRFLNLGICFEWTGSGEELLAELLKIEKSICGESHRDADGRYIDRRIDIDLIALGNSVVNRGGVIIPHPRMSEREFVLRPMSELNSGWIHPELGKSVMEMLEELRNRSGLPCGKGE